MIGQDGKARIGEKEMGRQKPRKAMMGESGRAMVREGGHFLSTERQLRL